MQLREITIVCGSSDVPLLHPPQRTTTGNLMIGKRATQLVFIAQTCTTSSSASSGRLFSTHLAKMRGSLSSSRPFVSTRKEFDPQLDAIFEKKRSLRSEIHRQLRSMSPEQRAEEDIAIQNAVLDAPWFKSIHSLCAYANSEALREVDTSRILSATLSNNAKSRKKLYLPRMEDRNSNMRMLRVLSCDDLVPNSWNILEPSALDSSGNPREDVMLANEPVDLFILPGVAFDKSGRRLGRGGGYYDIFLEKYQQLSAERKWKKPLLVALSYSVQMVDKGVISITSNDIPVDAVVSPAGVMTVSSSS